MISVIIPVYNISEYLSRCFDSLIAQNNDEFEVIMVNDGSSDNSEEVCRQYELKDARFKLYNKPNGGVSRARNCGLHHAKGEWIVFVDGDDVVDNDYLTLPTDLRNIDVIEKSYCIKEDNDADFSNVIDKDTLIEPNCKVLEYYSIYIQANSATLCNKIIRRGTIDDKEFDETKSMGEDFIYFVSIIARVKGYYKMSKGTYYYMRRMSSASKGVEANRLKGIKISFENMKSVRDITRADGIKELGDNLIYARYLPSLLSLHKYLLPKDWFRLFLLWISFPFANKTLMSKYQRHSTLIEFPRTILSCIRSKIRL